MAKQDPLQLLEINRGQALSMVKLVGKAQTKRMLKKAQKQLNARLRQVEGLQGAGKDSFTAAQLRVALEQIKQVMLEIQLGMQGIVVDEGANMAAAAVQGTVEYIKRADEKFTGVAQRLPIREAAVLDHAVQGTESSILRRLLTDPVRGPGILERYGENVISSFEQSLQQRFLAKTPWEDVRNELIANSEFLEGAPGHWAERIVRTELMGAHNRASWEGLRAVNKEVRGGMLKILVATFDSRTGADSYAVHGQIRRPHQAFQDWYHLYQYPPNRPNDRETTVPHSVDWPIPAALHWKTDAEVSARWVLLGNKRALPPRPKMTTVPLDKIGKAA